MNKIAHIPSIGIELPPLIHNGDADALGVQVYCVDGDSGPLIKKFRYSGRNDQYIFYIQETGILEVMVDFASLKLQGSALFFICPGQVHSYRMQKNSRGYFILIDPSLVPESYKRIFSNHQNHNQMVTVRNKSLYGAVSLLAARLPYADKLLERNVLVSLIQALVGMMVSELLGSQGPLGGTGTRRSSLSNEFRRLVRNRYVEYKRPMDYAALLRISVPYLNEVVKEQTGYTASHWIQQEILLEAKRLLHDTGLSSKEVAFSLGYEDVAYFSRFFKRHTNMPPLQFRKRQRTRKEHS